MSKDSLQCSTSQTATMCKTSGGLDEEEALLKDENAAELEDLSHADIRADNPLSQSSSEVVSHLQDIDVIEEHAAPQIVSVDKVSRCFVQSATYCTHRLQECVDEVIAQDVMSTQAQCTWSRFAQMLGQDNQEVVRFPPITNSSILPLSTCSLLCRESISLLLSLLGLAMMEAGQLVQNVSSTLCQGFFLPFLGFRSAWQMSSFLMNSCQVRLSRTRNRFRRIVHRLQTTVRGSVDDIGWLQRMPDLAPVEDKTIRFVQLLGLVSNGIHKLPNSFVYLLIPGLFSNHGPLYFVDTKKYFSKLGLACHIAKIHSEASVETNALELKNYIEELYWGCGKRVMLLGHSKGGVDAAAAIAKYWPDLKSKVVGLVLVQSPYGGSPIASDILRRGQIADLETRRVMELFICKIIKGDIRSLEDLTYDKRQNFLAKYPLPSDFPMVSFHTEVNIAPGVLATMAHIAHAELPWLPLPSVPGADVADSVTAAKLPVIIPLAAAMAICALHLKLRYGETSDGLVVRKDAEVPGSFVVRPDRKLDHAWMVYSCSHKEIQKSDASQMCEALLTLLLEVSQKDNDSHLQASENKADKTD